MLFIFVVPKIFLLGSVLVVIGVTCLGSSFVLLNSFLPLLVKNHPLAQGFGHHIGQTQSSLPLDLLRGGNPAELDSNSGITRISTALGSQSDSPELKLSAQISSKGIGIGYAAAVFVQILSILVLFVMSKTSVSSTLPLRLVLSLVGAWWFAFTIPSTTWLRSRPGPPLKAAISKGGRLQSYIAYVSFAWASLWQTVKVAVQLRQMLLFLIAWFLLSDAIATVSGTAILFARTELRMGTVATAILSIVATASGILGAFTWPLISRHFGLQTNRTIVLCTALMEIIPLYGLLGYVSFIKSWGVGGLQQAWEIYPLGFIFGFLMGGLNAYSRSFFGLLIPPGSEAAFYALYAITDKGSSAVGPTVVGRIVDATGTIRPAFIFLAVLIALPAPMIWMVDAQKGQADAASMAGLTKKKIDDDVDLDDLVDDEARESAGLMRDHD